MPQEFLASFAVDIDEGGANRLQSILARNRELADGVAGAFDAAHSSMLAFIQSATEELSALPFFSRPSSVEETLGTSGTFAIDLDFSKAAKQLETFMNAAKKKMSLSADGSGIVSAASAALSQVSSMVAGADLTLKIKTELDMDPDLSGDDIDIPEGVPGSSGPGSSSGETSSPVAMLSAGGRFSSPTRAEIAETGDPEYVVPVRKENEAVSLIRSLLSELSASARDSLRDILPPADDAVRPEPLVSGIEASSSVLPGGPGYEPLSAAAPDVPGYEPLAASVPDVTVYEPLSASAPLSADASPLSGLADLLSSLPDLLSAAPAAAAPVVVPQAPSNHIQAPVNIHVEASAADPEAVGRSIYDTAERYLLRTLQTVP